jgi:hypothetical protein
VVQQIDVSQAAIPREPIHCYKIRTLPKTFGSFLFYYEDNRCKKCFQHVNINIL